MRGRAQLHKEAGGSAHPGSAPPRPRLHPDRLLTGWRGGAGADGALEGPNPGFQRNLRPPCPKITVPPRGSRDPRPLLCLRHNGIWRRSSPYKIILRESWGGGASKGQPSPVTLIRWPHPFGESPLRPGRNPSAQRTRRRSAWRPRPTAKRHPTVKCGHLPGRWRPPSAAARSPPSPPLGSDSLESSRCPPSTWKPARSSRRRLPATSGPRPCGWRRLCTAWRARRGGRTRPPARTSKRPDEMLPSSGPREGHGPWPGQNRLQFAACLLPGGPIIFGFLETVHKSI